MPSEPDDVEELEVCPKCHTADIRNRNPTSPASGSDNDANYRCGTCGELFDEPARRQAVSTAGPGAGGTLASKLAKMDPDDLATDGGEDVGRAIARSDEELGPFREAKSVNGKVLVRKRRVNLVQELYLDEDDLDAIREVLEDDD